MCLDFGFADFSKVGFDSIVQQAGIAYPSDASLMMKLEKTAKRLTDYCQEKFVDILPSGLKIDIKAIKTKAREYFFLGKNKSIEIKREVFKELHKLVKTQIRPLVKACESLSISDIGQLPWNMRQALETIQKDVWRYLLDVGHFTRTHTIKAGKILSFHAKQLACTKKGKLGKPPEFGRVFQLGRIGGNFMFVLESTSIMMNDKASFIPLLQEHQAIFGKGVLHTLATDKGYWTKKNQSAIKDLGVSTAGFA